MPTYSTSRPQKYFSHRPSPLHYIKNYVKRSQKSSAVLFAKQFWWPSEMQKCFTETWIYGNYCCLMDLAVHLLLAAVTQSRHIHAQRSELHENSTFNGKGKIFQARLKWLVCFNWNLVYEICGRCYIVSGVFRNSGWLRRNACVLSQDL